MTNAFGGEKVGGLKRWVCLDERLAALQVASLHYLTVTLAPNPLLRPNFEG